MTTTVRLGVVHEARIELRTKPSVIVVSGQARCDANGHDDNNWSDYSVEGFIGPYLVGITKIVLLIAPIWWEHDNSDEDDNSGFKIFDYGGFDSNEDPQGHRVRIWVPMSIKGEHARTVALSYHLTIEAEACEDLEYPRFEFQHNVWGEIGDSPWPRRGGDG